MIGTFKTSESRWEGLGPYYAMFPVEFAKAVIKTYTAVGDSLVDPFAGRGTSVFAGVNRGRQALGMEINPVGWVYGKAKVSPATSLAVEHRLREILRRERELEFEPDLPEFFKWCYSADVARFLVTARSALNWRRSSVDWTLAALLLVYLHGKRPYSLSNQMRQSKAMSPDYAVRWWKEHELGPPHVDVERFMTKRIRWRYAQGQPSVTGATLLLGDAIQLVARARLLVRAGAVKPFTLLLTSPPYIGVTNYHYDQWLRLWLLGGKPDARRLRGAYKRKFVHIGEYTDLVNGVFSSIADLCAKSSTAYVRVDAREPTFGIVHDALVRSFPKHTVRIVDRPFAKPTQTALFGDKGLKPGERDIVLS